jgi:ABC-type multidrug transport system fused ATPase/permease subunit
METLKRIFYILTPGERKHAGLVVIMISIMALLDMIGVASILPFMAVVTNPDIIQTNAILNEAFQISNRFGVENNRQFLFALGICVFLLLVISLTFKALTSYVQLRFVQMRNYSIAKRVIQSYLHQPYSWFLNRNSAELGTTILLEVGRIVGGGLNPLMELISRSMIAFALITLLFLTDFKLAMIVGFTISGAYGLIFYFTKSYLNRLGKESLKNNQLRFTAVSEAFGAAKEVKVSGLEQNYIKRFSNPAQIFARNQASVSVLAQIPRYFLEIIAFGGVMLMMLYLIKKTGSFNNSIPIISLYVFAGYRLMPAIQQIYTSVNSISYIGPSLNTLYYDLNNLKQIDEQQDAKNISLNKSIILKNVNYDYPNASRTALKDINIDIPAQSTIGIVGPTGSGKTTIVDVILGLLEPQKGTLEVDEQIITKNNCRIWQRLIGYVPQDIYLADDTISANIAFGKKPKDINYEAVEKASKIANLHDFVSNELPEKYQSIIGERGIRLSGGQRQRIGIARALYHNPQLIILDEATSALDNDTEKAVMDAIDNIGKNKTIIIIAHRLSTVKKCDKIFLLEKGELKKQGKFEELITKDYKLQTNRNT